jgi:alpha-L-fucosidase 2
MQQYLFTGNTTFLAEQYPVLKAVLEFYLTFMTEGPNGWKVTNPSISPENSYYLPNSTVEEAITMGPTIDNSLVWELIGYALEALEVLDLTDTAFVDELVMLRSQLPPLRESYFGGIQEWIYDYRETDPGHRHFSPLWGLYPGSQIASSNGTTFNLAKNTLIRRLSNRGGSTGWSCAWSIALAARSFLSYQVHDSLIYLLVNQTYNASMLDTGPPAPFQIDGNLGAPAGMVEALLQSHELVAGLDSGTGSY